MKYRLKETSIYTLSKFFSKTPNSDFVSLEQIFTIAGKDLRNEKGNRRWIINTMTHLRRYDLVIPTYKIMNGNRFLNGYMLTDEGRRALGKTSETNSSHINKSMIKDTSNVIETATRSEIPSSSITMHNEGSYRGDIPTSQDRQKFQTPLSDTSLSNLFRDIAKFKDANPEYEIIFDIRLKNKGV